MSMDVALAYRTCEQITRDEARNFFYGIRLLPPAKRRAMCAVYAFARRIDDIGDGSLPSEAKLAALAEGRASLNRLAAPPDDAVLVALADACERFPIPREALEDLVDGVEMDVRGVTYETFDELVVYCRHVAGSVGRLCLGVFGTNNGPGAWSLADDLGVAMQLTNILRDVREDFGVGRVYLPAEDLRRFGCPGDLAAAPPAAAADLIRFEAARDREWFDRGLELLDHLDARSRACVLAMTGIYRRLLTRIEKHPDEVLERRMSVPTWEKAWVAARSLAGVGA
jgi:15-cis-phytoene synthase